MDWSKISAVLWKEFIEIKNDKATLIITLGIPILFGLILIRTLNTLLELTIFQSETMVNLIDNLVFRISFFTTLFIGFILTTQIFYREKINRTIENLLCTPMDFRTLWFGKILFVFSLAYSISLFFTLGILTIVILKLQITMAISLNGVFLIFVVLPILAFSIIGLIGFLNLLLLNPRIINTIGIVLFVSFTTTFGMHMKEILLNWKLTTILFIISLVLLVITSFSIRFLNKERIILTIP